MQPHVLESLLLWGEGLHSSGRGAESASNQLMRGHAWPMLLTHEMEVACRLQVHSWLCTEFETCNQVLIMPWGLPKVSSGKSSRLLALHTHGWVSRH